MKEQFERRNSINCISYIIIYSIVGIMIGLIFDVLATYLMAVSPNAARSISSYMGFATFAASAAALLAPKVGYKRIIVLSSVVITASLVLVSYSQIPFLISAAVFFLMSGTTVFDVILSPFIAANTTAANRTSFFTRSSLASAAGVILGTFTGGPMIVWILSRKLNISYSEARVLTGSIENLNPMEFSSYASSHRMVLLAFAAVSILMLVPVFAIRESSRDYISEGSENHDKGSHISVLINRYVLLFLLYAVVGQFAAALIVPQVSIYLTKLGINRASVSMISTFQYSAMLIFMAFSARIVKKVGQVNTIVLLSLSAVPFMIVLANGYAYGTGVGLIVGTALFFRAGMANAAAPVVNSLSMEVVPKDYRSLYASLVFVMRSLAQISAGLFGRMYLFNSDRGYASAYYVAAVLYFAAHIMLLTVFSRKYNQADYSMEEETA